MERFLVLLPVGFLAVGDVRRREVGVWWLVIFAVCAAVAAWRMHGVLPALMNVVWNAALLIYLAGGVLIYLRVRYGRWTWREFIGGGDLFFLAAATPIFGLRNYLLFLLCAAVFSLIWWAVARVFFRANNHREMIPFVATSGIIFAIFLFL